MKMVLFTNYTNELFAHPSLGGHDELCKWDNVPYKFPAGMSVYMEDWKAEHFAKHLVDRELNKLGKVTNSPDRKLYIAKCIGAEAGEVPLSKVDSELANLNSDLPQKKVEARFCDKCDSKGVRHKKECPTNPKNQLDEEKFEGIN